MRVRRLFRDQYGDSTPAGRRAVVVLGVLLTLTTGFAVGKNTAGSSSHVTPTGPATTASPPLAVAPLDPVVSAHGASPQTQAGAVTAAAAADCVLGGALVLDPQRYQAAIEAIVTPNNRPGAASLAQAEVAQVEQKTGAISAARQGARVYISCVPLGYRVESYAPTSASIAVWTEQIIGVDQSVAPASSYVTETLHLRWIEGSWKLERSEPLDAKWAPAPLQTALPQGALPAQLVNFIPFGAG